MLLLCVSCKVIVAFTEQVIRDSYECLRENIRCDNEEEKEGALGSPLSHWLLRKYMKIKNHSIPRVFFILFP